MSDLVANPLPGPGGASSSPAADETLLIGEGLCRRFGGLAANHEVNLRLERGRLHAVLGPNGAGKSTLINLLAGELQPSAGRIMLFGQDITRLSVPERSRRGLGRSYQRTTIFLPLTVFENVRLAAESRQQGRWWRGRRNRGQKIGEQIASALAETGLSARADDVAASLSHGEQRQLEIAMVLASEATVLLLDEPLAGMGNDESAAMVDLLKRLIVNRAILLVEHDMDAVFAVADTVTVMVNGQVLASGCPSAIRANPAVQQAYLGENQR